MAKDFKCPKCGAGVDYVKGVVAVCTNGHDWKHGYIPLVERKTCAHKRTHVAASGIRFCLDDGAVIEGGSEAESRSVEEELRGLGQRGEPNVPVKLASVDKKSAHLAYAVKKMFVVESDEDRRRLVEAGVEAGRIEVENRGRLVERDEATAAALIEFCSVCGGEEFDEDGVCLGCDFDRCEEIG